MGNHALISTQTKSPLLASSSPFIPSTYNATSIHSKNSTPNSCNRLHVHSLLQVSLLHIVFGCRIQSFFQPLVLALFFNSLFSVLHGLNVQVFLFPLELSSGLQSMYFSALLNFLVLSLCFLVRFWRWPLCNLPPFFRYLCHVISPPQKLVILYIKKRGQDKVIIFHPLTLHIKRSL